MKGVLLLALGAAVLADVSARPLTKIPSHDVLQLSLMFPCSVSTRPQYLRRESQLTPIFIASFSRSVAVPPGGSGR